MLLKVLLITSIVAADAAEKPRLSERLTKTLTAVAAAYSQGDWVAVSRELSSRAVRLKPKQLAEFDRALAERGLPSTGELMLHVRMRLEEQGRASALPRLKFPERMLMLAAIDKRVKEAFKSSAKDIADYEKAPAPNKLKAFEDRLRLLDVTRRKLAATQGWASYSVGLASKIVGSRRSRLKPADREIVEASYPLRVQEISNTERDIEELQMEIRLARLKHGVDVLKNPELSKERFMAAYSTGVDAEILRRFLKPPAKPDAAQAQQGKQNPQGEPAQPPLEAKPISFSRPALNEPGLADEVAKLSKTAKQLAGELAVKAGMFFEGINWWLRGRYGWGPDLGGLAKSEEALKDPNKLLAVGMPFEPPTPISPTDFGRMRPTHIDRRHHYTWAWEDRKLVRQAKDSKWQQFEARKISGYLPAIRIWSRSAGYLNINPADVSGGRANTLLDVVTGIYRSSTKEFYRSVHLPPRDPRLVYRLVGFVEYGKALELLDEFLRRASLQEIEIADEIVGENDQFLVYINLSRRVEKPSLLSEPGRNARDDFARRGLRWVLALARVELGAMLAGFSTAANPFVLVAPEPKSPRLPKAYGAEEFAELLLDGTRMHYWSLKNDPAVWNYYKTGVPENHLVTYGRRVTVARHFLVAARQFFARSLNQAQHAVLNQWEQEIAKVHRMLLYCLSKKVGATRTAFVKSSLSTFDWGPNPGWKTQKKEKFKQIKSGSPLHEVLLMLDPTLYACPCN